MLLHHRLQSSDRCAIGRVIDVPSSTDSNSEHPWHSRNRSRRVRKAQKSSLNALGQIAPIPVPPGACRNCRGRGLVPLTREESELLARLAELSQFVFGKRYFLRGVGPGEPTEKLCPTCESQGLTWHEIRFKGQRFITEMGLRHCAIDRELLEELAIRKQDGESIPVPDTLDGLSAIEALFPDETKRRRDEARQLAFERLKTSNKRLRRSDRPDSTQESSGITSNPHSLTPAEQITLLSQLTQSGAITQSEFDSIKQRLIEGEPSPNNDSRAVLAPGDRVAHKTLGNGVVLYITGSGESCEAMIHFDSGENKKLNLAWSPLTRT